MAFGKGSNSSVQSQSFRQQVRQQQAARPKFGGGGAPYFVNKFAPSTDEADTIRVLRGNYEVEIAQQDKNLVTQTLFYYPYTEHFHNTLKKGGICSAGPLGMFKGMGQPCLGCDIFWADKNAGKKHGPMSKRDLSAFTVVHFAPYAKTEQTDDQGQIRKNDQGQPYFNWVQVLPHERHKYQGKEMRDFNVMHWSLGSGHLTTLTEYDKEIGKSCKSCGGRDTIVCEAWCCRHCGSALIEPSTTTLSAKEIEEFTGKEIRCAVCHKDGMLEEIISCKSCDNAQRAGIFDVDMQVKRVKSPDATSNQTSLMIPSWSNPRPLDQRYVEVVKNLDLVKTFAPTPIEKQQEMWAGVAGGRSPVTNQQMSREYSRGGDGVTTLGGNKPQY